MRCGAVFGRRAGADDDCAGSGFRDPDGGKATGMHPQGPSTAALCDPEARPRTGQLVQAVAVLLTAAPMLAVAVWSLMWAL